MNKDQLEGAVKVLAGKVREQAGNLIGSPKQVVMGLAKQVSGKAQKGRGDVKEIIKDFNNDHRK